MDHRAGRRAGKGGSFASAAWSRLGRRFQDINWALSRQMEAYDPTHAARVRREVLRSANVQEAMLGYASESGCTTQDAEGAVRKIMDGMFTDLQPQYVRAIGYLGRKILRQMYESVFVNQGGIDMLRRLQAEGVPVILLPTHKSHFDYVLAHFLLFAHNIKLPRVVAGDNLNIPVVGPILQRSGAFFIRRSFSGDRLYKAVFHEYLAAMLRGGATVECFIEGGRSRSGKVLAPKTGFLDVVCGLVDGGRVPDAVLVPISITYDKVVEGASFTDEMLGKRKQKETLRSFLNAFNRTVRLNFGSVEVTIADPIRVRPELELSRTQGGLPSYADDKGRFTRALAYQCLYACNTGQTVTATMLVAAVLLTTVNRGVHMKELVRRVEWLRGEVELRGGRVARLFSTESPTVVVERALRVLGRLVQRQNNVLFGFKHRESLEISMYRNQLVHYFVSEALVAVAMAAEAPDTHSLLSLSVGRETLLRSVAFISQLLKLEFVYKIGPDLEDNLDRTLADMKRRGVLAPDPNDGRRLTVTRQGVDIFSFLCRLLWPFVDTYFITVSSLVLLQPDKIVEQSRLCRMASSRGEALFYSGISDFFEVVNVNAIQLAVAWCVSRGVLVARRVEGVFAHRLLQLAPDYQAAGPEGRLTELITEISRFRMPSMSRRNPGAVLKYYEADFDKSERGNFFARLSGGASKL